VNAFALARRVHVRVPSMCVRIPGARCVFACARVRVYVRVRHFPAQRVRAPMPGTCGRVRAHVRVFAIVNLMFGYYLGAVFYSNSASLLAFKRGGLEPMQEDAHLHEGRGVAQA
jgi:hypothetical protein